MSTPTFALLQGSDESPFNENRVLRSAAPTYQDRSDKFRIPKRDYRSQYAGMYFTRLVLLRRQIEVAAKQRWPELPIIAKLKDMMPGVECVVAGTLYKVMKLKPSVLKEYIEADLMLGEDAVRTYMDSGDNLILEDETARHAIVPSLHLPVSEITTGMVIGCKAKLLDNGHLDVADFTFPALPDVSNQIPDQMAERSPHCIVLVSGLGFGLPNCNHQGLLRLKDFLVSSVAQDHHITRLVVAGDTLENACTTKSVGALETADLYFASLASALFIDVMPGPNDPTGFSLPQQPLSPALFPVSRRFKSFRSVPNPYEFAERSVRIIGSSGQCVRDIAMYSKYTQPIDGLEVSVKCRCLAPGAPDTVSCYPFPVSEPFTLGNDDDFPHVVFSGCHDEFAQRRASNGTVLISVPKFHQRPTAVLVDLDANGVYAVQSIGLLDEH